MVGGGARTGCRPKGGVSGELIAALVIAALALPGVARAEDPKAEAKRHVDHATELHKGGKFAEALDELKTAYALDPQPQLLYAMGQLLVNLGHCDQAINYYQRFVDSKPSVDLAQIATEAIAVCKTNPPPAIDQGAKPSEPAVTPPPVAAANPSAPEGTPWYGDYLADGLVGAGVVSGVLGILFYRGATSDRDSADHATGYAAYKQLVDSASSKRTTAVVFGVLGAGLIGGGAVHFMVSDRVQVAPAPGGATVSIAGRF